MTESRLFQILYYLLQKGHATAPELAERLEVSVRTIYRDVDALSRAGLPVYTEPGRDGGIYLLQDYVLEKAVLTEQEREEILSALQGVPIPQRPLADLALTKLSALFHLETEKWLEVDFSRWGEHTWDNTKFELLRLAILQHRVAEITYVSTVSKEKGQKRKIWPLKLSYKSRGWYLKAFCLKRQDFRLFKLNRILKLELLEEHFTPISFPEESSSEEPLSEEPSSEGQAPERQYDVPELILHFSKEAAYRVYDEFTEDWIEQQDDGSLLVTARMPVDAWLTGYLLSFGTEVEILAPTDLKKRVAEQITRLYQYYQDSNIPTT